MDSDVILAILNIDINEKEKNTLNNKLNQFSTFDFDIFKDIVSEKKQLLKDDYDSFIDNINDIYDVNGLFLDGILYHVRKLIPYVKINVYTLYNKELSHYIVTDNQNSLKMLGQNFWKNLNEFDYECVNFLIKQIDDELNKYA